MADQSEATDASQEKKPKAQKAARNPNAQPVFDGRVEVGTRVAKIRHILDSTGQLVSLRALAAFLCVDSFATVHGNLLKYDKPATKAAKQRKPPNDEVEMMDKWKKDHQTLFDEMIFRGMPPRKWLAAYGVFDAKGYPDVSALADPDKYKALTGRDIERLLMRDFPKSMNMEGKQRKYIYNQIKAPDFMTKITYPAGKGKKGFNTVLENKELKIKMPMSGKDPEGNFTTRIYQEILIRRMDMILEGGFVPVNIKRALYWLPRKNAEIKRQRERERKERNKVLTFCLEETASLEKALSQYYILLVKPNQSPHDLVKLQDLKNKIERNGVAPLGKQPVIYKSKSEFPQPTFMHKEIGWFWEKHIANGWCMQALKIGAVQEILTILDTEGDVSSVVDKFDNEIIEGIIKEEKIRSTHDLVKKVPLWRHSLNVAEEMIKIPRGVQPTIADEALKIDLILTGLAHDLGKLPSARGKSYARGEHPELVILVLDKCPTFRSLHYWPNYFKAIRDHHVPHPEQFNLPAPSDTIGLRLRKADIWARKEEFAAVAAGRL